MFSVTLSSNDSRLLQQVEKYGLSKGCLSSGIVEHKALNTDVEESVPQRVEESVTDIVPVSVHQEDTTFYEIYGIVRDGGIGYVGYTKTGAARRISQHLRKAEMAMNPFVQWLAQGLESKDIEAGVITTAIGLRAAIIEEKRLIRKLQPAFNKQHGEYGLINKIGGLKPLQIEGPTEEE